MKLIHLADLHLGKRVNGFSMIDDQKYILTKIINVIDKEKPDAVLIAGDIYDRSVPSEEAVDLFDDFLVRLAQRKQEVFIISGNHDSAERVAFGGRLMDASGIHLAPVYDGTVMPFMIKDKFGAVAFYLIPFLKPANVRNFYPDEEINSYTDAMRCAIRHMEIDGMVRNVALAHQFVAGAATCDSEERSVGGLDEVDVSVFDAFDYVALGHLHGPQGIGRETVRYAGSPLKYSFSEANQRKCVTVVELMEKGDVRIHNVPLEARRDFKRISGTFDEITGKDFLRNYDREDYYEITLTDEEDVPNALDRLRRCYPNLMIIKYDNTRTRTKTEIIGSEGAEKKSPLELFGELFELQNGKAMSDEQRSFTVKLIEEIWGEEY